MPYNENDLTPTNLNAGSWGLAWTRFWLRDKTDDRYSDTELTAALEATSFVPTRDDDNQTYYRPHLAAASIIDADPDRALQETVFEASETKRSPERVARSIRRAGRWVDDAIAVATEERPPSTRQIRATF